MKPGLSRNVNLMADEGAENPGWRLADGLRRGLRGLWAAAVDAVYPPVCAGCGRMTGQHRGVCPGLLGDAAADRAALLRGSRAAVFA